MDRDGHDFHAMFQYMFYTWIQNCTIIGSFLSSLFAGRRDLLVTTFVRCMCVRPCVRPVCPDHNLYNNAWISKQLLHLRRRSAIWNILDRLKVKVTGVK